MPETKKVSYLAVDRKGGESGGRGQRECPSIPELRLSAGKGFRRQLLDGTESQIGTNGRGYNKARSTEPFIKSPHDASNSRLLTVAEHAAVTGIPADLVRRLGKTVAHEILGQIGMVWGIRGGRPVFDPVAGRRSGGQGPQHGSQAVNTHAGNQCCSAANASFRGLTTTEPVEGDSHGALPSPANRSHRRGRKRKWHIRSEKSLKVACSGDSQRSGIWLVAACPHRTEP